jgi:hypothetical protein
MSALRVGLMLALALVVAVVANLVLLDVATGPNDPVGKLSPRAELIPLPRTTRIVRPTPPPPTRTTTITRTTTSPVETPAITPTLPPPQPPTATRRRGDGRRSGREQDD